MKLKEILELKYGKSQKKITGSNGRYPIFGTGGILGYSNVFLYNKPSVIIGRKGSINNKIYIDFPFWVVDTTFYTIIDNKKVIPRWFYYYISTIDLNKYNEGTTIPSLTIKTLYELDIPYFPLEEQQHIVDSIRNYSIYLLTSQLIHHLFLIILLIPQKLFLFGLLFHL